MWRASTIGTRKDSIPWICFISLATLLAMDPVLPLHAKDNTSESFPYTARVVAEGNVYAGPGKDFLLTDRVPNGAEVEVYRHDGAGWCAIRPPASSFSWVAAEHLEITENPTLARVINIPVKTRVGSNFSNSLEIEYISLREGEILELRGSRMLSEKQDRRAKRWFKIAPPSGEFRWIHVSQLKGAADSGGEVVGKAHSLSLETGFAKVETFELPGNADPRSSNLKPHPGKVSLVAAPSMSEVPAVSQVASSGDDTGFVETHRHSFSNVSPASHNQPVVENSSPLGFEEIDTGMQQDAGQPIGTGILPQAMTTAESSVPPAPPTEKKSPTTTHVNVMTWEAVGSPTDPLGAPEPRNFVEKYNALNVMLSRAILGDVEGWELGKLSAQCDLLLTHAESKDESDLAQALAAKVAEFQALQDRSLDLETDPAPGTQIVQTAAVEDAPVQPLPLPVIDPERLLKNKQRQERTETAAKEEGQPKAVREMPKRIVRGGPGAVRSARELRNKKSIDNSIFDASGILVVVKSRTTGIPKYALTDKSGSIKKFLSAKDGSSLARFINKEVGVLGRHGFIRKLQKPHVVAEKVVLLKR